MVWWCATKERLGGHGSFTRSSSSITRLGADGVPVTEHYSSTTRAAQGVTETNRAYRHSNGFEKLGVARTVRTCIVLAPVEDPGRARDAASLACVWWPL
jgi:hypothetical protein